MFWRKKKHYMAWEQYQDIIETWDSIAFAQRARKEYVKHMPAPATTH